MKKIIIATLLTITTTGVFATETNLHECYGTALSAAKAIDSLNFPNADQSNAQLEAVVQKSKKARINVSLGLASNRLYTVRLKKNRSAELTGDQVTVEPGCYIESVN